MLGGMETGVSVLFEEAQHVFAPHEVQLAGLHGFDRQLVSRARNHRVQSQNFTRFRDSHNECFAFARGGREFGASLAQYEDSAGTLSLHQNHGVFGKNRGMLYFVESRNRLLGEVAEKMAERRWQSRQLSTQRKPDIKGAPPSPGSKQAPRWAASHDGKL